MEDNNDIDVWQESYGIVKKEDRTWGMVCHFISFIGFVSSIGTPIGNVVGPLIIWVLKKDTSLFVDAHGKESMNFQISMSIYLFIFGVLAFIPFIGWFIFAPLYGLLLILNLILVLLAGIKANEGKSYKYPMTIRFIK